MSVVEDIRGLSTYSVVASASAANSASAADATIHDIILLVQAISRIDLLIWIWPGVCRDRTRTRRIGLAAAYLTHNSGFHNFCELIDIVIVVPF